VHRLLCTAMLIAGMPSLSPAGEIHKAAVAGDVKKVRELLAKDPSAIAARDENKNPPLNLAASAGHLAIVQLLIEKGADVNSKGWWDTTPLYYAALYGHRAMVDLLLKSGADVNGRPDRWSTPLHASDPEIVKTLLRYKPDLAAPKNSPGAPLERAAGKVAELSQFPEGKQEAAKWQTIVDLLLDAGAYYDIYTAIHLKDPDRVRLLLKKDKSLVKDQFGRQTPLRMASEQGNIKICKLLLDFKADPDDIKAGQGHPVLYSAIGHPAIVKLLLQAGAPANARITWRGSFSGSPPAIKSNATLLHYVAAASDIDSARLFLEKGVKIDAVDNGGQTSLHVAAMFGRDEMVRFLLDEGADINARDKNGLTPLGRADSRAQGTAAADVLRKRGAK
jgi:ankyrin repeat protein